eukprot:TRINITY_DN38036_c0_g1_i1.p3 TRINITY_DN38036_c0_g1~~TRINITY_DN38036_c0_g1_i1.p3  ORF type:complete len:105 (+),score=17.46 TRINITY_DN38036_c0_g1_i1:547-861(+)
MNHRKNEHQVQDIPTPNDVVKNCAEGDIKLSVEIGENIGIRGLAKEEITRDCSGGIDQETEHRCYSANGVHFGRAFPLQLVVDGLHIEVANKGVCHDRNYNQEI